MYKQKYANLVKEINIIDLIKLFFIQQAVASLFFLSSQSFIFDCITVVGCQIVTRVMIKEISMYYTFDAIQIILIHSKDYLSMIKKAMNSGTQVQILYFKIALLLLNMIKQQIKYLYTVFIYLFYYILMEAKIYKIYHFQFLRNKRENNNFILNLRVNIYTPLIQIYFQFIKHLFYYYSGCNAQARKLKIEDDESFNDFSKNVTIDFNKSKIDVEMQKNRKTLKDYLLLKHYQFSKLNAKEQRQIVNQTLQRQETIKFQRQETMKFQKQETFKFQKQETIKQQKQENAKGNQPNADNHDNILNQIKNDILYVSFESPHKPGTIMKYKIKAGALIVEQPYIILTMQDISSEINLNDLKIKSTKTDIIFIKSINEIRDKVVKIINFISSSRFFPSKSSNAFYKNFNKGLDESYSIAMSQLSEQQNNPQPKNPQCNEQIQDVRNKYDELNEFPQSPTIQTKREHLILISNNDDLNQVTSPIHTEQNIMSTYQEPKVSNIQTTINESNNNENVKQLQINQLSQQTDQINHFLHPLKPINTSLTKNGNLLTVPTKFQEQVVPQTSIIALNNQTPLQGKISDKFVLSRVFDSKENEEISENGSETKSIPKFSLAVYSTQQNLYTDHKQVKKSIIQSQLDEESSQCLENEDYESNKSLLKLRLSCLLNNTYSLLDYLILTNEKSYFKKLSIKPQSIPLTKLDSYLKILFPNLIIQYHNTGLQEKEIKTDIRRLKYVLISIISSFYFQKKNNNNNNNNNNTLQLSNRLRQSSIAHQIQSELSPLQQKNRLNVSFFQGNFQDYDKQLEIYLDVCINEEPQFSSINFSVQSVGNFDNQEQQNQNNQLINSYQEKKRSETICYQFGKTNKKSENEFLSQLAEGNFCANATTDPIIKSMEAKNIYSNIMAIGPYVPEFEPTQNVFSFEIFENIEVIETSLQNQMTPFDSPSNASQSNNMNFMSNKSVLLSQQFDIQTLRNSRKSNFYQGNGSSQITSPSIKSQENLKKKNGQQSKSKFNSNENIFNKKKIQVNDLIKQLEIAIIKENIHSYNEECETSSFKTFTSGIEQEIEECSSDTEYNTRQIPICSWNKQTDKQNLYQ